MESLQLRSNSYSLAWHCPASLYCAVLYCTLLVFHPIRSPLVSILFLFLNLESNLFLRCSTSTWKRNLAGILEDFFSLSLSPSFSPSPSSPVRYLDSSRTITYTRPSTLGTSRLSLPVSNYLTTLRLWFIKKSDFRPPHLPPLLCHIIALFERGAGSSTSAPLPSATSKHAPSWSIALGCCLLFSFSLPKLGPTAYCLPGFRNY